MKFRLRDFCNGANLRRADLEGGEQYIWLACVASVSVRFRSKERGTRVKDPEDRAKNGTFFVDCLLFVCQKLYKWKKNKSNYLNSDGEEAQEKPPGL